MKVGKDLLQWNDALATGSEKIDQQHKVLITILNEAYLCFRDGKDADSQGKLMEDLIAYTVYHFDTEEELMEVHGYGNAEPADELAHIQEHRAFANSVTEYQLSIQQQKAIDYPALFDYLSNWLVNHVMGTDKKLGGYIRNGK